jgi:hypothetical protein
MNANTNAAEAVRGTPVPGQMRRAGLGLRVRLRRGRIDRLTPAGALSLKSTRCVQRSLHLSPLVARSRARCAKSWRAQRTLGPSGSAQLRCLTGTSRWLGAPGSWIWCSGSSRRGHSARADSRGRAFWHPTEWDLCTTRPLSARSVRRSRGLRTGWIWPRQVEHGPAVGTTRGSAQPH